MEDYFIYKYVIEMCSTEMWKIFSIAYMDGRTIEMCSFFSTKQNFPRTDMWKGKEEHENPQKLICGSKSHIGTHS